MLRFVLIWVQVCLLGEIVCKTEESINYEEMVRDVCKDIGYDDEHKGLDSQTMTVLVYVFP